VPVNRLCRRKCRVPVMPRLHIALEFALVAAAASGVADESARSICVRKLRERRSRFRFRACSLGLRPPVRRTRQTQDRTHDQKCRPYHPPWKPWPQLVPVFLARPLPTICHLHEPLPCVPQTCIVSDVPLDKPAAPIVECRGAQLIDLNRQQCALSSVCPTRATCVGHQRSVEKGLQRWRTP